MSDATLGALVQALPFGALLIDERGSIVCANADAARLAGRAAEELPGRDFFAEYPALVGDEATRERLREASASGFYSATVLIDAAALSGAAAPQLRVHVRGLVDEGQARALVLVEPLFGESGLRATIQRLEDRILEIRRCRHEINNLLMGLMGQGELLGGQPELSEVSRKKTTLIVEQSRRIRDELKKMAGFTKDPSSDR